MTARVLRGDVRRYFGVRDVVVLRTERGRAGEARTMVVIGDATTRAPLETRSLATVAAMPLVRRAGRS